MAEDYISFETAKLLKKKGLSMPFDSKEWICCMYDENGNIHWGIYYENWYFRITLQMAMKWLREVHKLYINIWADPKDVESNDFDIIFRAQVYNGTSNYGTYEFSTYEEAAEAAIKYCLENLI